MKVVYVVLMSLVGVLVFAQIGLAEDGEVVSRKTDEKAFSERSSWKHNIGFHFPESGYGIEIGLTTPSLFSYSIMGKSIFNSLGLFYWSTTKANLYLDDGDYVQSHSRALGLVWESRNKAYKDIVQNYSQIGALYIMPDGELYDANQLWGMYIASGIDIVFVENRSSFFGSTTSAISFYAEFNAVFFVPHADDDSEMPEANIYNGIRPQVGIRAHF